MCGIAGAIDEMPERAAAKVRLLNDARAHRGPDHRVIARVGGITFGNTRLAIQDPIPAGHQPFVSADGRYTCVFNGEMVRAARAGLAPVHPRRRWAETWALTALNAWLETWAAKPT